MRVTTVYHNVTKNMKNLDVHSLRPLLGSNTPILNNVTAGQGGFLSKILEVIGVCTLLIRSYL
jgi:hypothetical protein